MAASKIVQALEIKGWSRADAEGALAKAQFDVNLGDSPTEVLEDLGLEPEFDFLDELYD